MNLIDLKRKVRELTAFIKYQEAEIEEQRNTIKGTNYDKTIVSGTPKRQDMSDVVARIIEMEQDVEKAQKEYDRIIPLINELEAGYKELNDRDKLIYTDRILKGYSMAKLECKYGLCERQIRRILKKVEKNIKCPAMSDKKL